MFLFWNVCSQLEQRGCGWVIAKGKCYILMEAARGAILLKHTSFAFFYLNFSITSELGRHIDVTYVIFTCVHSHINYCPYLKALWLNTVTLIHLKTFFFTINNLRSRPASWSSGQGLWLLIMRSRVRFPVLPRGFFLAGEKFPWWPWSG